MSKTQITVTVKPHVSRLDMLEIEIHEQGAFVASQTFVLHNSRFPHHHEAVAGEVSFNVHTFNQGALPTVEEVKPTFVMRWGPCAVLNPLQWSVSND